MERQRKSWTSWLYQVDVTPFPSPAFIAEALKSTDRLLATDSPKLASSLSHNKIVPINQGNSQ